MPVAVTPDVEALDRRATATSSGRATDDQRGTTATPLATRRP
ncbi:hypothetical protein W824_09915 [Clavibacter cf. michiganensis LMG 26808]|nr:hypothetical protein W824_09915 [Clavibacter cf. michiganensis LMG 26808]